MTPGSGCLVERAQFAVPRLRVRERANPHGRGTDGVGHAHAHPDAVTDVRCGVVEVAARAVVVRLLGEVHGASERSERRE